MAVEELDSPPSMRALYPKALAASGLHAARRLPLIGGGDRDLPDTELVLHEVEIDRHHVARYDHVCGFTLRETLPPTYPHIVAFPLAMRLMTDTSFPFAVVGLVHIENRIEQLRPIRADEKLTVRVHTGELEPHERGTQFKIHNEAESDGEVVWRSVNTYLHKEGGGQKAEGGKRDEPPEPKAIWDVPGDIGRRYGDVSGDINPIHLHTLTARLFGMPRAIAHGMWTKARCLAALEGELPDSFAVDVRFKLPVLLPAKVAFSASHSDGGWDFAVHDAKSSKPHLAGHAGPLPSSAR